MAEAGQFAGERTVKVKWIPLPDGEELFKRRRCGRQIIDILTWALPGARFLALLYRCRQCGTKAIPPDKARGPRRGRSLLQALDRRASFSYVENFRIRTLAGLEHVHAAGLLYSVRLPADPSGP
ncbi:MAG: hypothetical protein ACREDJ_05650 [Methylocella sp.]